MAFDVEPELTTAPFGRRLCNFPTGRAETLPAHEAFAKGELKTLLKGNPGAFIDLLGFASKLGFASGGDSNQKNLELSKRRIAAVKQMILRHNPGTRFNVEDPKGSADDQGPRDDNDGFFRAVLVKVFGVKRPGETPVTPPTQSADIVVRYRGAEFNKRLSLEEVLPDPLIATYRAKHAADRTLTRIGAFTKTPQADDFLTEDLKKIQEVTKDKAVGKICILGTSNGGNNALRLAQRVLAANLPLAYVGVADPVFFPSDTTDRPSKNEDPPDVVPTFRGFAGIRADVKENFFEVEGNHTRRERGTLFTTITFTSDMDGQEIHGELDGFPPRQIRIEGKMTDFQRHVELGKRADPEMEKSAAKILNDIPSDIKAP